MLLDAFKSDLFGLVNLTASINKMPYKPQMLGASGIFSKKGIYTTDVAIEDKQGKLSLVAARARGTMPQGQTTPARTAKKIPTLYLPANDTVMADEVQNVRAFGSESEADGVSSVVNDKLQRLRDNLETTLEYQRVGAIQGITYDADGTSVLFNWFTEFGVAEQTVEFPFDANANVYTGVMRVVRLIENALGATVYNGIKCYCGDTFFDNLVSHASVKSAFQAWQQGSGFKQEQVFSMNDAQVKMRQGFVFAGVEWINYRGQIGSNPFIPAADARFVVDGVSDLYMEAYAPAPFVETVNTKGLPTYAKQRTLEFDVGVEIHSCSCPVIFCTRPGVLIKGHTVAAAPTSLETLEEMKARHDKEAKVRHDEAAELKKQHDAELKARHEAEAKAKAEAKS